MVDVIALTPKPRKAFGRPQGSGTARIVFFTGVRYVREEAEADEGQPAAMPASLRADERKADDRTERLQA
jgi:hypothetical protein